MRRLSLFAAFMMLFFGCSAADRGLNPRTAHFPPPVFKAPKPIEGTLSGGARTFLLEDRTVGLVRVYLSFAGGEVNDPPGKEGLSEVAGAVWRMGGTEKRSAEGFDEALEEKGIELSLFLGREGGGASLSALPEDLDYALDLLAELVFTPAFSGERLELSKKLKLDQERREKDDPDSLAFRELRRVLYADHPRGRRPTEATITSLSREDLLDLHRDLVKESAWVAGAVGDFDPQLMAEKLEKRFGALGFTRSGRFARPPVPKEPKPKILLVKKKLPQTTLLWASFGPPLSSADRPGMELADFVLGGGGFNSRLATKVRVEKGLAYSVGSFYSPNEDFGVVGVKTATRADKAVELYSLLSGEIARAGADPYLAEEVSEAKKTMQNRFIFRFRDPADLVRERMGLALKGLPPDLVENLYRNLAEATPETVSLAASKTYAADRGVWVLVGEVDPAEKPFGQAFEVVSINPE